MISRIALGTLMIVIFMAAGCQESTSQSDRRTQLIGHENLQLKKQLQQKDREIERLQGEIKKLEQKAIDEAGLHEKTLTTMMEIMADTTRQLEACKAGQ